MTVDLDQFVPVLQRQEDGIDVQVKGMDGKPLGLTIRVAGPDSDRARGAREDLHRELVDAQRVDPLTPGETYAQGSRFLAKVTLGWSPRIKLDGEERECTEANAIRVYDQFRFIREQVDRAAGNRAAFMVASSGSSAAPSGIE